MALTAAETNFVNKSIATANTLISMYGTLVELDQLWAGAADFDAQITQGDIDTVVAWNGLTTTILGDAQFAMAAMKTSITNALQALSVLANLKT
jgi:hypothetical protein